MEYKQTIGSIWPLSEEDNRIYESIYYSECPLSIGCVYPLRMIIEAVFTKCGA